MLTHSREMGLLEESPGREVHTSRGFSRHVLFTCLGMTLAQPFDMQGAACRRFCSWRGCWPLDGCCCAASHCLLRPWRHLLHASRLLLGHEGGGALSPSQRVLFMCISVGLVVMAGAQLPSPTWHAPVKRSARQLLLHQHHQMFVVHLALGQSVLIGPACVHHGS